MKENFCLRKFKKKIRIGNKNVIGSEETLMHKAERPSNYFSNSFTHNQAEQIKKGVICVHMLLEIHHTEHSRFHFRGWTTALARLLLSH